MPRFTATARRSAIECLECKERIRNGKVQCRWVDSDQQVADGLTNMSKRESLLQKLSMPYLCLQYGSGFTSAKKKRKEFVAAAKARVTTKF